MATLSHNEYAVFGGGCFWCLEAIFERVMGVLSVTSGYAGGHVHNPTYAQVCSGQTGHAEVVRVEFAPEQIDYGQLLKIFWQAHDPTQVNGQGPDHGTQYRSIVLACNAQQYKTAQQARARLDASGIYHAPLCTQIELLQTFYPAESYHQHYYRENSEAPYCQMRIKPKLDKFDLTQRE